MEKEKVILYITYDGLTDPLGQSQILPYIFRLSKEGFRFVIISFEKKDRLEKYKEDVSAKLQEHDISWYYGIFSSRIPILSKMSDLSCLHRLSKKVFDQHKPDIIHCRSYVASLAGLSLNKKYDVPFIFDMRGLWADERFDAGIWNRNNPLRRLQYKHFIKKEKEFLEKSAHVVSLTHKAINIVEKRHGLSVKNKTTVIRTCTDTAIFNNANKAGNRKKIRESLKLDDDTFLLVYSGSTGTWYMIAEMIRFFEVLLQKNKNSRFLFLTNSTPESISPYLTDSIKDKIILRSTAYSEVCTWLNACDAGIYFIHPWFSKNASTATKTGEMASCGLPVVANAIGDMESVFEKYNLGVLVNGFTNDRYSEAAEKLLKIKPGTINIPEEYTLDCAVKQYKEIFLSVSAKIPVL